MVNPYQPPASSLKVPAPGHPSVVLKTLVGIQSLIVVGGLVFEAIDHENIVGIGPLLFLVGLCVSGVAARTNCSAGVWFGLSAIGFCGFVVLLINLCGWGPAEGDLPISMLAYLYSFVMAPIAYRLLVPLPSVTP